MRYYKLSAQNLGSSYSKLYLMREKISFQIFHFISLKNHYFSNCTISFMILCIEDATKFININTNFIDFKMDTVINIKIF